MGLPASAALICIQIRGNESEVFAHGEKQHNNSGQSMFKFRFLQSNRFQSHKLELDTTYQIIIKGSWLKKQKKRLNIFFLLTNNLLNNISAWFKLRMLQLTYLIVKVV